MLNLKLLKLLEWQNIKKITLQISPKNFFVIKKVKNTLTWTNVINDLNGEKTFGTFYEKGLQKTNQKEFRIEKAIKKKGDKLYIKWKWYNNSMKSCIGKKRHYQWVYIFQNRNR